MFSLISLDKDATYAFGTFSWFCRIDEGYVYSHYSNGGVHENGLVMYYPEDVDEHCDEIFE